MEPLISIRLPWANAIQYVSQPRPKEAWRTVVWESRQPYLALRHNCNDVAYDVLRAYGTTELLDPAQEHVPNDWYNALPGHSYTIAEHPVIPVQLRKMSQRELATREIELTIPPRIKGAPPPGARVVGAPGKNSRWRGIRCSKMWGRSSS